ncbi:MAG: endonuclease III [Deltaproteobacteria bacterium]|nr:endonuclease III [Deltaproteobacteria bacterium]
MDNGDIDKVFSILEEEVSAFRVPIVGRAAEEKDSFKVLISTMLSLRTKDKVTEEATTRLFSIAPGPKEMSCLDIHAIEDAIYPVGFYKTKARNIKRVSSIILERYNGRVPGTMEGLLELPGVGRKTANLVLTLGFNTMGICVDTHVMRITNRWGYVSTKNAFETEMKLRKVLPKKYWKRINDLLVTYGQNLCTPISPFCSKCRLRPYCDRVGVKSSR